MSDRELHPFIPDWTLHPCVTLREVLQERGITAAALADMASLGPETVAGILGGTAAIDGHTAGQLEAALGGPPARFWLNYQANYERDLARGAKDCTKDHLDD